MRRLLVLASHPIPYQAPLFRELAARPGLVVKVLYGDNYGVHPRRSRWGIEGFTWQGDLLEGYSSEFLPNWAPRPDPSSFFGKLNPDLPRRILAWQPDAVLVFGYASLYAISVITTASLARIPLLYLSDSSLSTVPGLRGLVGRWVRRRIYSTAQVLLVGGQRNRQHYLAHGVPAAKLVWCPFSVGNKRFARQREEALASRARVRATWGVPDSGPVALYVGRLSPEKRVDDLVSAMTCVPDLTLVLVGTGPTEPRLRSMARVVGQSRVVFAGFRNQHELPSIYAAADLLVLPSRYEPWGLVCNEAMNFGLPIVVSTDVGCGPDLAVEDQTGTRYPTGDTHALAAAILHVLALVKMDAERVRRSVLKRVEEYSESRQADGIARALRLVCQRPPTGALS